MTTVSVAKRERKRVETLWAVRERPDLVGHVLVAVVGLAYLVTQLLLFGIRLPLSWDESVYVSQSWPGGALALPFEGHRARGIAWLVAPVASAVHSVPALRVFLLVLFALGLAAAFSLWVPIIGRAAAVAAAIFGFSWLALINGEAVIPNLPVALLLVAATGLLAREVLEPSAKRRWGAAALLGLAAVFRPTDATYVAFGFVIVLAFYRTDRAKRLATIVAGLALGWLPWLIEAFTRFGGPLNRLRTQPATGLRLNFIQHLSLLDGPQLGPERPEHVSWQGAAWWATLIVLVIAGVVAVRRSKLSLPFRLALAGAAAILLQYFFFTAVDSPRFLLTAYALLAVPAAVGMASLVNGSGRKLGVRSVTVFLAAAVTIGLVGWHVDFARKEHAHELPSRTNSVAIANTIKWAAYGRPCSIASESYPAITWYAGCQGRVLTPAAYDWLMARARAGDFVAVLRSVRSVRGTPFASWRVHSFVTPSGRNVRLLYPDWEWLGP